MNLGFLDVLSNGLSVGDYRVKVLRFSRGRFREELNVTIGLVLGNDVSELLYMKVFTGRPPFYRPWIEVFGIRSVIRISGIELRYFDSRVEDKFLELISSAIEPGDRLFIEYYNDYETLKALELGVPPVATRLGFKLFMNGFTWFKDWYYPEGFMEGNPKLQAEKPLTPRDKLRHLDSIRRELNGFIKSYSSLAKIEVIAKSISRAKRILDEINYMVRKHSSNP